MQRPSFVIATLAGLLLVGAPAAALASFGLPKAEETPVQIDPSPELTPAQVVEIQLGALGANAAWGDDRGIALAFRFASPSNRAATGPLPRFVRMVRGGYGALLDHRESHLGALEVRGNEAAVPVIVIDAAGERHGFVWFLRRQDGGAEEGCWMTDAVMPVEVEVETI